MAGWKRRKGDDQEGKRVRHRNEPIMKTTWRGAGLHRSSDEDDESHETYDRRDPAYGIMSIVWALRAARIWIRDNSLEEAVFVDIWGPFRDFLLHMMFIISLNITCFCRVDRFMFLTFDHIETVLVNNRFQTGEVYIQFEQITTPVQLWDFLKEKLPAIMMQNPPGIQGKNFLIGQASLRQIRVKNASCHINSHVPAGKWSTTCYGYYSESDEDKEVFERDGEEWHWTYLEDGSHHQGYMSSYPPSGYIHRFPRNPRETLEQLKELRRAEWIDAGTRIVFLEMVTFNANKNELCSITVHFELPPGAGIIKDKNIVCGNFLHYRTPSDFYKLSNELMFVVFSLLYTLKELKHLINFKLSHYFSFWKLLHLIMLGYTWACIAYGVRRYLDTTVLAESLKKDGFATNMQFERVIHYGIQNIKCLGISLFLSWVLMFKYAHFNLTTEVVLTMQRSRYDLISYLAVYIVIHYAFAQLGHYMFGNTVSSFKTFSESALSILDLALTDFSQHEILDKHRTVGAVYLFIVIFVIVFVFHNMFFVILSYHYDVLRDESKKGDNRDVYFGAFFTNGWLNICKAFKINWVLRRHHEADPMRKIFHRCGFTLGSIKVFEHFRHQVRKTKDKNPGVAMADFREVESTVMEMVKQIEQTENDLAELVPILATELEQHEDPKKK